MSTVSRYVLADPFERTAQVMPYDLLKCCSLMPPARMVQRTDPCSATDDGLLRMIPEEQERRPKVDMGMSLDVTEAEVEAFRLPC